MGILIKRTNKILKESLNLCVFTIILFATRSAIADWNRIPTGSMEPSIYVGDLVPVNKLAYDFKVPKDSYLMLGDNRDGSADSRYFGFVPRQQIVGRAERVIISWDKEDKYQPRFNRFLSKLI